MPALPLVSVVSAFYNRAGRVAESISSVLTQDYPALEVIVVNDGSRDDTLGELRKLDDRRLTIITRENRGFVASMNEAIAASRGDFIAVHGSGDLSLPGRIVQQAKVLVDSPDIGVVGCWVDNDETDGPGSRLFKAPRGLDFHSTLLSRGLFTHGEVMFRRAPFDAVGGYRDFFRFAQDRDLCRTVAGDTILYRDDDHLTNEGAWFVARQAAAAIASARPISGPPATRQPVYPPGPGSRSGDARFAMQAYVMSAAPAEAFR